MVKKSKKTKSKSMYVEPKKFKQQKAAKNGK